MKMADWAATLLTNFLESARNVQDNGKVTALESVRLKAEGEERTPENSRTQPSSRRIDRVPHGVKAIGIFAARVRATEGVEMKVGGHRMSLTNKERIGRALDLLQGGLGPYADREFRVAFQAGARVGRASAKFYEPKSCQQKKAILEWDISPFLLKLIQDPGRPGRSSRSTLKHAERSLVSELREVRNRWAHQGTFTPDDAYRGPGLGAAPPDGHLRSSGGRGREDEAGSLGAGFDEQTRGGKRRSAGTLVGSDAVGGMPPWREVVAPHPDMASGRYQQAEFAADLWQVHLGEGTDEYRNPVEFFRRTYLTESMPQEPAR